MSKQKRRRETVLRRFRRTVRKIILIRSILDQIRLGSVLTPYNQHELTSNGIYDLVLAGHQSNGQCKLDEATVAEEFDRLQTLNYPEQKSFLLASNFIKVSTLLYLMTPFRAAESGAPSIPVNEPTSNPNDPKGILDTSPLCCSQHGQRTSLVMLPIKPPAPPPPPPSQLMSSGSRSRLSSTQSHRPVLSRQNTVSDSMSIERRMILLRFMEQASSHYDSTASDGYSPMVSASTSALAVNSNGVDVSPISNISSSRAPPEEDALINQISSLLTNYLLSHPSTKIKEKFTDIIDHETLNPNRIDYSISSAPSNNHQDPSGSFNLSLFSSSPPSSSLATSNEFDRLLHRIKTTASNTLSRKASNSHHIHESASHHRKPSLARGLRRQLFSVRTSSYHETSLTDYDPQHLPVLHTKHRFDSFSKSQSLDETDSGEIRLAGACLNPSSVVFQNIYHRQGQI